MLLKITRTTEWFVDISDDEQLVSEIENNKDVQLESIVTGMDDHAESSTYKAKFIASKILRKTTKPVLKIGFKE